MYIMNVILLLPVLTVWAYSDIDERPNYEEMYKNKAYVKEVLYCAIDKGPCSDTMKIAKTHILEAVNDACRECDDFQRHVFRVFLRKIKEFFPEEERQFMKKYDPTGTHFAKLLSEVSKY